MHLDSMMWDIGLKDAAEYGRKCERIGYDCVWTYEAAHNPFMPLAQVAAATDTIHIGTNIAVAFARSPYAMAQAAWDLAEVSKGRFHLGIGSQVRAHIERRFSAEFEHPAARLTDYIRCVRAVWDSFQNGTKPAYEGPYYRYLLNNPMFNPGPIEHPDIPIYVAGVNPRMCRVAGEVADGMHVHPMHSVSYLRDVVRPAVDKGARMNGRTVDDIAFFAPVFVITGETEAERAEAEKGVRHQIGFYGSTPNYRALLEHHGYESLGKELSAITRSGEFDKLAAKVPDDLLEACSVAGAPEEIAAKLRKRYEGGLMQRTSLYFSMPKDAPEGKWRDFVAAFKEDQ